MDAKNKGEDMANKRDKKPGRRVQNLPAKTLNSTQAKRVRGGVTGDGSVRNLADGSVNKIADGSVFKLNKV